MSLTPAAAETLRHALATAAVVPVTPLHAAGEVPDLGVVLYVRNERITGAHIAELADRVPNVVVVRPPSRPLPADLKAEITGILASWGLT